ncbi:MAG: YraN family protein [Candidatus Shapirobacteria bacterium]|nr:YraN family protein [Candidatus Shapirobacteria bacterium]
MAVKKITTQTIGQKGEEQAVDYLARAGYQILDRNFRISIGELDIVALDNNQLVLVEVKTRTNNKFGFPEEAINKRKLIKVKQVGQIWASQHPGLPQSLRIDLIAILNNRINHYQNIGEF